MRHILLAAALALAACTTEPTPTPAAPIILSGEITRADHQTYRELPFTVPVGTGRITIDFTYDKANRTVIDLGLRDPGGQRGWSGGNKSSFTVSEFTATPSYKPGKIQPGEWKLILGIPNIREGQAAHYEATITFSPPEEPPWEPGHPPPIRIENPAEFPLSAAPGWRRGDFHTHTWHSDGSCDGASGRGPCPSERTFLAASDAGLDFVAITDHNTITQLDDIRHTQGSFGKTLLIPGTEITTFNGHANAIGNTNFLDFQLGSPRLPTLAKLFDEVDAAGGILSVNHPSMPSGEACMGCGWTVKDTDWSRVTAMEVLNGSGMRTGGPEGPLSGIRFWDNLLKQGHRITAIGGSDNHDATDRTGAKQPPIGSPTTVVYANELSTNAIIAGVRSGRAFIDVTGLPGATLDIEGVAMNQTTAMGGELVLSRTGIATITAKAEGLPPGSRITLVSHGVETNSVSASTNTQTITAQPVANTSSAYIRPEVRSADNKLLLLGNPIYIRVR